LPYFRARLAGRGRSPAPRAIASAFIPPQLDDEALRVIELCRAIELAMAGLYETLAELHARDGRAARLWRKTAREEHNHAAQLSLLLEAMSECIEVPTGDAAALAALALAIETTIEEIRLHPPTVREALGFAIDFEEWMDRAHAHQAVTFSEPRCHQMFLAMMAADRGHVASLRMALRRLRPG